MSLPIVVQTRVGNLHTGEPALQTPVNTLTIASLSKLTQDQLTSLQSALNDLIKRQSLLIKDETKKKANISSNISALRNSVVRIPDPRLPDLDYLSGTISSLMHLLPSDIGEALQEQIQLSSETRDPKPLQDFQKRKGALITGNLARNIAQLLQSYATINGLRLKIIGMNGG